MRADLPTSAVPLEALTPTSVMHFEPATLVADDVMARMSVAQFTLGANVPDYTVETLANGNHMVRGLKIFKSGTFKDSKGRKNTWTAAQLAQMAENYQHLVTAGLFVDVPTRADHTGSINSVVGYLRGVRADAAFLYADVEFTEQAGWAKFESGTFRARSAEIGFYESNDEELFWPVVCGVAFVDVGAVEGLYSRAELNKFNLLTDDKDSNTMDEATFLAACAYAQAEIDMGLVGAVASADHQAALTAARTAAIAEHSAGQLATFQVNGQATQDYGQVQAHITTMETAATEQASTARKEFVKGLATGNKIAATQVDTLAAAAVEMTDATFAAFRASYELAPANALFGIHGAGPANLTGESAELDDKIVVAEGIVAQHRRAGMADDVLKTTESFQRLEALKAEKAGKAA